MFAVCENIIEINFILFQYWINKIYEIYVLRML